MINIRELSVGSYVRVYGSECNLMVCQIIEVLRDETVGVKVCSQSQEDGKFITGMVYNFPLGQLDGIECIWFNLREFGFADSDERGWSLVYWYGTDMKLLYRPVNSQKMASFRFKSDYRKSYVRISCKYVHELQNIMRFLTGGELEFEYKHQDQP